MSFKKLGVSPEELKNHEKKIASEKGLGHVKIGEGINVDKDGTISVDEVDVDLSGLEDHVEDKNNPHEVTKEQVGLGNVKDVEQATKEELEGLKGSYEKHENAKDNPHNVTKEQVGLGNVTNEKQATKEEFDKHENSKASKESYGHVKVGEGIDVEDGVISVDVDTSDLITKEELDAHKNDKSNPHNVTKAQVGLSNLTNDKQATKTEHDAHVNNKNNPHNVTKGQVGLGSVDNVKQATKSEFDRHVATEGDFSTAGHVKLSNATESNSSVSHGVAATPQAVKTVNDKLDSHEKVTATKERLGHVTVGKGLEASAEGELSVRFASTDEATAGQSNDVAMTPRATAQYVKEISGESAAGVLAKLDDHIGDTDNPHEVTKEQVGLGKVKDAEQATKEEFDGHISNKNNPHSVTKAQVGLGNVSNYGTATKTEAEAGTATNKYMTPKTTADAIKKQAGDAVKDHTENYNNPHKVTKGQVGLGNVDNYKTATKAQAESGEANNAFMTPLRVMEFLQANGVNSVAGVKRDKDGNVPLTIADLTVDSYLPPSAPPRDYSVGVTSFRTNSSQAKDWGDLVGDKIVNTRFLVMTIKAHSTWQAAQFIFGVDGYANTGNTIRHRNLYVRSAMASNLSDTNSWSDPVKIVDEKDLKDAIDSIDFDTSHLATKEEVEHLKNVYIPGRIHTMVNEVHGRVTGSAQTSGHVYLSDEADDFYDSSRGVASTPKAVDAVDKKIQDHTGDEGNPHNVTKEQVGLGDVDNVKQATKSEFDRHASYIGNFSTAGHVKLSNHTTSENSVSHGVAATPLAVKTVNDRIDDLDSEDITVISPIKSDVEFEEYPLGVTVFYNKDVDEGYPFRFGTVLTAKDDDRTCFQLFSRNGFNEPSQHIWYRIGHYQTGWTEWFKIADNRDIDDVKELAGKAQKTADEALQAGVKQKQATADSLTSIGASLPSDPTWDRLQSEIKKADYVREARVTLSEGQTVIKLNFHPLTASGVGIEGGRYKNLAYCNGEEIIVVRGGDVAGNASIGALSDDAITFNKPLDSDLILNITGVAKK